MKALLSLGLIAGLLSLSACNSSSGAGDPNYASWYDVYGNACGWGYGSVRPGCNYFSNHVKIMAWQDPYWNQWVRGEMWYSPSGIWYDVNGYAINSADNNDELSADVITQAAEQEGQVVRIAAQSLSQRYALSEAGGVRIAQSLNAWANLGRDRARTDADIADFSQRIYGVSADKVKVAIAQAAITHSLQAFEDLNVDVAAYWGTTPEVSKMILKKWHQGELSRLVQ